ncbi:MAG: ATP-dependent DNA helicase RecG [Deltaproteobacteria bacterium]|nr:ATP-dependent DNA helicase RecG [Deltaproteobacteria bacterium]NND27868.1 ATP-dependent DNA helicase RecG [Myxococcales bacterium]MBT8465316.1 ATP-dependent DNA helicase RecG [Deltaproteobacteria bacterium]MBT8482151.1 ATP-dependent DNA helicase RecG [Deltaproteobacteria bacterium]NNK41879.1 ATP-dependent DNA helicase RecG [Myxococcales bacterium]
MPTLLDHLVETLPGIGPTTGRHLRERGYATIGDLLWLLPRGYDDQRTPTPIDRLQDGQYAVVEGVVRRARSYPRGGRMGFEARVAPKEVQSEGSGYQELKLVWFRAIPGLGRRFAEGETVRVAGKVQDYRGTASMAHPESLPADAPGAIEPRYPEIPGVRRKILRRAIRAAVDRAAAEVPDLIPARLRAAIGVSTMGEALREIHVPDPETFAADLDTPHLAHQRIALEELVLWELALRLRRASERGGVAQGFAVGPAVSTASAAFAFELTPAQKSAVAEISAAIASEAPMRRLLQGDVGCGKTAVAMVACAQVHAGGGQAVFLAPTELLADQHAETLRPTAQKLGLRVGVLTGALSKDQRRSMLDRLATGAVDLVVGTHALLSGEVRFSNLGLVIVDEQHRFGVAQRLRLGNRGARGRPHLLVMTATPIPRSLALVLYAGLDLTSIDAKPPGRIPVTTKMLPRSKRDTVIRQIARAIEAGGRAFVVCPAISASDELVGVDRTAAELQAEFGNERVGRIHGQLSGEERRELMRAFSDGELQVLVGTTVLEVGVDVPAANLMVIEQAERFGIAQLHQLRGRVGRAGQRSACLLTFVEPISEEAESRLEALCETDDGFVLAERDLELRGPGHLFGYRQSGASGLQFASLAQDQTLLGRAGELADRIIGNDPNLSAPEHASARAAVERWERNAAVREDAG